MIITKEQMEELVKDSVSYNEVLGKTQLPKNGTGHRKIKKLIADYGCDTSHFSTKASIDKFHRKYKVVERICPVCSKVFEVSEGNPKAKITCSYGCSNTYFAHSRNKPERYTNYRTICFKNWVKECILCGFDKVVEVHHLDHNHKNNDKLNLIPICPNHHQMLHTSKWGVETKREIIEKLQANER